MLFFVNNVYSQWVPSSSTIPDQVLALSRDGSTAIGLTGVYTKSKSTWSLSLPIPSSYKINTITYLSTLVLFLSDDGTRFAISNISSCNINTVPSIDIYEATSPEKNVWNVSFSINGASLGMDGFQCLFPAAATSDGNTVIIVSTFQESIFTFILSRNGSDEYVFKQQLLPSLFNGGEAFTSNGTILSSFGGAIEPGDPSSVQILLRQMDGSYTLTELYGFAGWTSMAISSNGNFMFGTVCTSSYQVHIFFRVNGRYQFLSAIDVGEGFCAFDDRYYGLSLPISSDASIIFVTVPSANTTYIFKQTNETNWLQVQTLPIPPSIYPRSTSPTFCSEDGSILLVSVPGVNNSAVTYFFQSQT
jgi:hypothetical protein